MSGRGDSEEERVQRLSTLLQVSRRRCDSGRTIISLSFYLSSVVCCCRPANFPVYNNLANHRGTSEPRADLSLNSFKVASNGAHMETPESQAQDTLITNGAAEVSTSSPPASPPPAVPPALSDLSTTAEQGKDGRRFVVASSYFLLLMSEYFCSKHYCCQ